MPGSFCNRPVEKWGDRCPEHQEPTPPGDYGSLRVEEVKCEAVDLATEGKHRSPYLDFLESYLPTPRTTLPYGSDPYEDGRVKGLEKALGLSPPSPENPVSQGIELGLKEKP
jgi:hypothetical protein